MYGKLYTFAEAGAIALPSGWRLPAAEDFKALYTTEGGQLQYQFDNPLHPDLAPKKLMSATGWTEPYGTNTSGFNAVGGGSDVLHFFDWLGYIAKYLTTSQYENLSAHYIYFIHNDSSDAYNHMGFLAFNDYRFPVSIRFVKDN